MKKIYIVAVVAALISSVLLYSFLNSYESKNKGDSKVNYNTEKVIVALTDIPANTTVTDKMVKEVDMPVDGIHPDAARERADVVGSVAKTDIVAEEQLLKSRFASSRDAGSSLSYQIEDGKRAMAISVDSESGVAGYIEVGDYVDVIAVVDSQTEQKVKTKSGDNMDVDGSVTSVIVEAAKVLRVGDVGYVSSTLDVYTSLTLELEPEQCAKIATARKSGTLSVTL
jgi:pilus assembly protein CpaB